MDRSRVDTLMRLHEVMTRIHAGGDLAEVLQVIADGMVEVSGFHATTINVLRADGDLELVAVAGDEPGLHEMVGTRYSSAEILARNADAEQWGMFRFIPHDQHKGVPEGYLVLDFEPIDAPDAWHPLNELSVNLHAPTGELIGIVYVDRPDDGRLPSPENLELMEMYAVQAGHAINAAQQREKFREAAWLGGMVSTTMNALAGPQELDAKLDDVLALVRVELGVAAAWLDVFSSDDPGCDPASRGDDDVYAVTAALGAYGTGLAQRASLNGEPLVLDRRALGREHRLFNAAQRAKLVRALDTDELESLILVPLDNDEELEGQLVLMRSNDRGWSELEREAARDVGRELGWALGRERSRRRARQANRALDQAARDRFTLLADLALELGPAMAEVDTSVSELPPDHAARRGMETLWTLFDRVQTLMALEHPEADAVPVLIDVSAMLAAQWPTVAARAEERGVRLLPLDAGSGRMGWCGAEQLEWLLPVLLDDAVGASLPGTSLRVSVTTLEDRLIVSLQTSGLDD
ncbi:MAG: hypothetical protein JWO46_3192, partial [Nocardioidaceae bacterium]|nr:hypothetical protein [Nocardioidaceae bacterium]